MEYLMPRQFIPVHPCLKVALSISEFNVYTSIIEQSMKIHKKYSRSYWSQATFLDYTALGRTAFNSAVNKLINKGLVIMQVRGNGLRNCYDVVESEFLALHNMFEVTKDRKLLGKFFKEYWKTNRRISEVSEEELSALRQNMEVDRIDENDVESENFKRYRRKTTVIPSECDGNTVGKRRCYIDSIDNKEISRCNLPNRGTSIENEKIKESGEEDDMFNLFDVLPEMKNNEESFLPKKKQKNITKELAVAKTTNNEFSNIIDELKGLQYNQYAIPSDIKEEMEDEDSQYEFKNILFYFSKRFHSGACVDINTINEYYEELRDDYFSSDILLNTSFLDVFRHFVVKDDKVYTFYDKIECELLYAQIDEEYNSTEMVDNIVYPESKNVDDIVAFIANETRTQFQYSREIHIDHLNNFIKKLMKGLEIKFIGNVSIAQPRLAQNVIKDLKSTDDEFLYWMFPVKNNKDEAVEVQLLDNDIKNIEKKISENKTSYLDAFYTLSTTELQADNIFIDIFSDFRITRRMDTSNLPQMVSTMLKFALIEESDVIASEEKEKLVYAIYSKLELKGNEEYEISKLIPNKIK